MDEKLYDEYLKLQVTYDEISAKRDELRDRIFEDLKKNKLDKYQRDDGTFSIARKIMWMYSPAVKDKEAKLKIAKKKEEEKGIATQKETEYLRYSAHKAR